MYIIDYIPEGEINGDGHYRLQDEWIKQVLKNQEHKILTVTLSNFILVLIRIRKCNIPIFMPNCSLYDRFSILDTLLLLITPFQKKIVILHTVSKINILNKFFCRVVKNCQIYVYSDTLRMYLNNCGLSKTNEVRLAQYPNANMISDLSPNKNVSTGLKIRGQRSLAMAWGNAAGKIDMGKLESFLEASNFDNIIIVGKNNPSLAAIAKKYPSACAIMEYASDYELACLLSEASINLMLFPDQYNFYKSKLAASGVYLTALKFGVPSLISGDFGNLKDEILSDGSSAFAPTNSDLTRIAANTELKMIIGDCFVREKINLNFFYS